MLAKMSASLSWPQCDKPGCLSLQIPIDKEDEDYANIPLVTSKSKSSKPKPPPPSDNQKQNAIDITSEDLVPRLTPQNVADLVLLSMVCRYNVGGLVQDCSNSSAVAMELLQSCTKPLMYWWIFPWASFTNESGGV